MDPFDDPDWLFDVKYDGFRGLCYIEPGRNRLVSRHGNAFDRFDALADQIAAALDVHDVILDGEIIAADETGRPVFIDLLRGTRALAYVAFDLLWLEIDVDLRQLPLHERRKRLQPIMPARSSIISEPVSVIGRGCELFELMCANDLEGVVAKRLADPYEPRVRWLKIKNPDYTQKEGRGDLFDWSRQPTWRRAVALSAQNLPSPKGVP
jgi:bifunctional non-homologous end joining protein LigD